MKPFTTGCYLFIVNYDCFYCCLDRLQPTYEPPRTQNSWGHDSAL